MDSSSPGKTSPSPPQTLSDGADRQQISSLRRYFLLVLFCLAQFMDAFNSSALFAAIPTLTQDFHFATGESTWIVSAYQLTFASFLLIVSEAPHRLASADLLDGLVERPD